MIRFKRHYYPDNDMLPFAWYTLTIGRLHLHLHRSDNNRHGPDFTTLTKGWRIVNLHEANRSLTYYGWRIIKYRNDGGWRHLDIQWKRK